jgi:CBS domain-containing membrane protein
MLENKYGCLPVVEGERLVGILTEADFVRLFAEGA